MFYITLINNTEEIYAGDSKQIALDFYSRTNLGGQVQSVEVQCFDEDENCLIIPDTMDVIAIKEI